MLISSFVVAGVLTLSAAVVDAQKPLTPIEARTQLGWRPRLALPTALQTLVDWYKAYRAGENMKRFTMRQIESYYTMGAPR